MTPALLQTQLQQPYRRATWQTILPQLLPQVEFFSQPADVPLRTARESEIASARQQIGRATIVDDAGAEKHIAVYEIQVASTVDLPRNRVALRELVARSIDQANAHAVLAFFIQDGRAEYRLTYAARESSIDLETLEISTRETAPKRFTFLLGPAEPCRTAAQRLSELATNRERLTFKEVEEAFSVERLNKEFFAAYKKHYQRFVDYLVRETNAPERIFAVRIPRTSQKEFDRACKPVRDFVKRLLGRIVFLHFLQRKGWLGCPAKSKDWLEGDREFMLHYFQLAESKGEGDRFHSRWLTPLFFDALNNPDRARDIFEPTGTRIPYLNGGLFEETCPAARALDFPADYFRELLEFFGQYNFTIDENDPEENEIGIDPEMLGHIFENLLEDNKDKGAYYTPKAIVRYMSQQALLQYLRTHLGEHPELDRLVIEKDPGDRTGARSWIREHAGEIERRVERVKICDPAVGSGAFPIGLLHEMLQIKLALDLTLDAHEAKKTLIQDCLHGVDLDAGAIEIARLRFWLTLVVDAKTPEPLPNLDYKLYCADSLIERLRGEPVNIGTTPPNDPQLRTEITRLVAAKRKLYDAHSRPEKRDARHELYAALGAVAQIELTHLRNNSNFADADFGRVLAALEELNRLVAGLDATKKAKVVDRERALEAIQQWFEDDDKPTFLWQLHFGEVFVANTSVAGLDGGLNLGDTFAANTPGGFDILIENPPYVSHDAIPPDTKRLLKTYSVYNPFADLYCYFVEQALVSLKPRGVAVLITSNSYLKADYGAPVRRMLGSRSSIRELVNIEKSQVFTSAIVNAAIVTFVKTADREPNATVRFALQPLTSRNLHEHVRACGFAISAENLAGDIWTLGDEQTQQLRRKIEASGSSLQTLGAKIRLGIATGANAAFVLSEAGRAALVARNAANARILKPVLRGRDVDRFYHPPPDKVLILAKNGVNVPREFPDILAHLESFGPEFKARGAQGQHWWNLRACSFYEDFERDKIVWIELTDRPRFALCEAGIYLLNTAYYMLPPRGWSARALVSLLNSRVVHFYCRLIAQTSGMGVTRWFKEYVQLFPIPNASDSEKTRLEELCAACQHAMTSGQTAAVGEFEAQIDQIVDRLFRLTPEEIAIIETATAAETALAG
jgi:hypothetical protein